MTLSELDSTIEEFLKELSGESTPEQASLARDVRALGMKVRRGLRQIQGVNTNLARSNADAAEIVAAIEEQNDRLESANREVARANAHAAELLAEIELRNEEIERLNRALSRSNAYAAELVAELEQRSTQLSDSNDALQSAVLEKSRLLGFASHDLRAGLSGITGLARVLCDALPEQIPGDIPRYTRMIREESRRLMDLLASLLDVSQVEQGRVSLHKQLIPLDRIVREAVEFHEGLATPKNQQLSVEIDKGPFEVLADPLRIRQVVDNLLSNAVKYSRQGGKILARLRRTKSSVEFLVEDDGPGITAEDFPKMFSPFQQLSARPTGGETSTGLGLAIARKTVELHLGRIHAANRPQGNGAVFCFTLPLPGADVRRLRILAVDDSRPQLLVLRLLLEKSEHVVTGASSGSEALSLLSKQPFDAVLVDVQMPGMDGYETARAIRSNPAITAISPSLAIIGISAHSDQEHADKCLDSGMNDVLVKPVDADLLAATLHRWTESKAATA